MLQVVKFLKKVFVENDSYIKDFTNQYKQNSNTHKTKEGA